MIRLPFWVAVLIEIGLIYTVCANGLADNREAWIIIGINAVFIIISIIKMILEER